MGGPSLSDLTIDPNREVKRRTVCQCLREIYNRTDDPVIKGLCEEAHIGAKKMDHRLKAYKSGKA